MGSQLQTALSVSCVQASVQFTSSLKWIPVNNLKGQCSIKQTYTNTFCVILDKSTKKTLDMIQQVFESERLFKDAVVTCRKCFDYGQQHFEGKPHEERWSTNRNGDKVLWTPYVSNSDRWLNVRMISDHLGIDKVTLPSLPMICRWEKSVPSSTRKYERNLLLL